MNIKKYFINIIFNKNINDYIEKKIGNNSFSEKALCHSF